MKNKKFIFLFVLVGFLWISCNYAKADVFVINLKYDFNTKFLDFSDYENKITIDKQKSISFLEMGADEEKTEGNYVLKVFDLNKDELFSAEFQPTGESFQVDIPFMATAQHLTIYTKKDGNKILDADLSQFLSCNNNGICEYEKKENSLNCLGDCANSDPLYSEQTKNKLKENNGEIKDPVSGEMLLYDPNFYSKETVSAKDQGKNSLWFLILAVVALAGSIGYLIYKKAISSKK